MGKAADISVCIANNNDVHCASVKATNKICIHLKLTKIKSIARNLRLFLTIKGTGSVVWVERERFYFNKFNSLMIN